MRIISYSIFCGDHFGCLSQCLYLTSLHQEVVFLISPSDDAQIECLKRMEQLGLFRLVLYDYKHLADECDFSALPAKICSYFEDLLAMNGFTAEAADEVFISNSGSYCLFELYLALSQIPYALVEFSKNEFMSRKLLAAITQYEEISQSYQDLVYSLGTVIGSGSACVKHIYCSGSDIDLTLPGIIDVFDPIELSSLPEETKQRILSSYSGFDPKQIGHISSLLIPNSESLTKRALSFCGKYYCDPIAPYTLLVDLLQIPSDRIMVKPHPHGSFSFDKRFENTIILDKTFPIEFLQLLPECRIEQMLSVETSAVDKVNNLVKHSIVASRFFMIRLDEMISLYTAAQLPLMLPHKKYIFFSHTAMEIKELIRTFAESVGVPRDRQLIVTNQLGNINPHSVTIVHSEEDAEQFGSQIHRLSVVRKNTFSHPVFSNGVDMLYLVGRINFDECCMLNRSFFLPCSGLEVHIEYSGEV